MAEAIGRLAVRAGRSLCIAVIMPSPLAAEASFSFAAKSEIGRPPES
ncbi:MAG: hypothetical protein WBQ55_27765 [Xanthobacteraceae bacterium]